MPIKISLRKNKIFSRHQAIKNIKQSRKRLFGRGGENGKKRPKVRIKVSSLKNQVPSVISLEKRETKHVVSALKCIIL